MTPGRAADDRDERLLLELGDATDGREPALVQLRGRHRPDAPEPLDREWMEERPLGGGRHDEKAVGLRDTARDLRQELRACHSHRDREADAVEDGASQAVRDLRRSPRDPLEPADVQERLVDRDGFHERRHVVENGEDGLARIRVRVHPRRDDDRVRAEASSAAAAHRALHAVRLRLVAGGQHDACAHDDGSPLEPRIVTLLDRGEERVEVGVEDRRAWWHEHMFALARSPC